MNEHLKMECLVLKWIKSQFNSTKLTNAGIGDLLSDASLEEAGAAVAAVDAVVLPERLVAADLTHHGHRQGSAWKKVKLLVTFQMKQSKF